MDKKKHKSVGNGSGSVGQPREDFEAALRSLREQAGSARTKA